MNKWYATKQSFTLPELLVGIGIIAILTTITVLLINPAEYIRRARDSKRSADISTLNLELQKNAYSFLRTSPLVSSTQVYISIPDVSPTCATVSSSLPQLPSGYTYHCAPISTLSNSDGTGWIPVILPQTVVLPIDPQNTVSDLQYYTFVASSTGFALSAQAESKKGLETANNDMGYYPERIEQGTNIALNKDIAGLVGYWPLNNTYSDISGYANVGSLVTTTGGSAAFSSGAFQNGICFSGNGGYIQVNDTLSLDVVPPLTVSAWIKLNTQSANNPYLFTKGGQNGGTNNTYVMYLYQDKLYGFSRGNSGTYDLYGSTNLLGTGVWHHVSFVLTETKFRLYTDGVLVKEMNRTVTLLSNNDTLRIGGDIYALNNFKGCMDDVRLYKRALSSGEIKTIYNTK